MIKTTFKIQGMHCRSCEILIKENIEKINAVEKVNVSHKSKEALVYSKVEINPKLVEDAITEAGYSVGESNKPFLSQNLQDYKDLLFSVAILIILFFIARSLGIFNLNVSTGSPSNLLMVGLIGLTAGVSTCMALVGGLVLAISSNFSLKHPGSSPLQKFRPHIFFNLGRIISFVILGGLIGLAGNAFQLNGSGLGILTIIVAIFMFLLGLQLIGIFPRMSSILTLSPKITQALGLKKHKEKEYSHLNSMLIGGLTFFLPCGFTQAMQVYAISTGSFVSGALIMGLFALGTTPGLLGIGGLTSIFKGSKASKFFKFTGVIVLALAVFNFSNGLNLTGWSTSLAKNNSSNAQQDDPNVKIEDGIQVVRMTQKTNGYSPNKFTIKKDIKVKWIINATDTNSCSGSIVMSKLKIRKFLTPGENIIEFTPTELGDLKFTCLMGMYTGRFTVVENKLSLNEPSNLPGATAEPSKSSSVTQSATPTPTPTKTSTPKRTQNDSTEISKSQSTNQDTQVIKTTYKSLQEDISPNQFDVKADRKVRFEVTVNVDGQGCMSTIMIPGLVNNPEFLEKDKTIIFEFTPKKGLYDITCAMGVVRGIIYSS